MRQTAPLGIPSDLGGAGPSEPPERWHPRNPWTLAQPLNASVDGPPEALRSRLGGADPVGGGGLEDLSRARRPAGRRTLRRLGCVLCQRRTGRTPAVEERRDEGEHHDRGAGHDHATSAHCPKVTKNPRSQLRRFCPLRPDNAPRSRALDDDVRPGKGVRAELRLARDPTQRRRLHPPRYPSQPRSGSASEPKAYRRCSQIDIGVSPL